MAFALLAAYRNLNQKSPSEFHFSDEDGYLLVCFKLNIRPKPKCTIQYILHKIMCVRLTLISVHAIKFYIL